MRSLTVLSPDKGNFTAFVLLGFPDELVPPGTRRAPRVKDIGNVVFKLKSLTLKWEKWLFPERRMGSEFLNHPFWNSGKTKPLREKKKIRILSLNVYVLHVAPVLFCTEHSDSRRLDFGAKSDFPFWKSELNLPLVRFCRQVATNKTIAFKNIIIIIIIHCCSFHVSAVMHA